VAISALPLAVGARWRHGAPHWCAEKMLETPCDRLSLDLNQKNGDGTPPAFVALQKISFTFFTGATP
jgi:hypothetical protein